MQSSLASLFPKALHFAETFFSFSSESEIFGKRLRNSSPRCVLCSISLNYLLSIFGLTILNAQSNNTVLMKYDNIYIFCVLCVYAFFMIIYYFVVPCCFFIGINFIVDGLFSLVFRRLRIHCVLALDLFLFCVQSAPYWLDFICHLVVFSLPS